MSETQKSEASAAGEKAGKKKKVKVEFGADRPAGVAGPEASYIDKSLDRWRLRGNGVRL